jgi:DNA-binding NtrC family response regulator
VEQHKQQILLVEDDPDVRELLQIVLEHAGYAVIAVEQGETALKVLKTTPCDLLVSDYHLPDTLGNRLIKQARTDQPGIATVLISGEPGVEYLAHQCGAHAWFRKGEMLDGLIAAVTSAFGARAVAI